MNFQNDGPSDRIWTSIKYTAAEAEQQTAEVALGEFKIQSFGITLSAQTISILIYTEVRKFLILKMLTFTVLDFSCKFYFFGYHLCT